MMFLNRCEKPDKKEFFKISGSCAVGFLVMGIIGYCIKLVFIPINNIILNWSIIIYIIINIITSLLKFYTYFLFELSSNNFFFDYCDII